MRVSVAIEAQRVRRALAGLSQATSNRAIVRALNRAVRSTRTEGARIAGGSKGELMLPYKRALQAFQVKKVTPGGHLAQAEIIVEPRPQEIFFFQARATPRYGGVTFKIKRGGRRSLVKGAFIATLGPKTTVFRRVGSARLPVQMLFTSSVLQLFKREQLRERLKAAAVKGFTREAQHQVRRALQGQAP
jgi:hypothetical protein